jgi:hypothetical protein
MIGFATTLDVAVETSRSIQDAQTSRGLPVFWLIVGIPIYSGEYSGLLFVPCDDEIINASLIGNPPLRPIDLPEFQTIIENLGGLDERIDIPPSDIIE